MVDLTLFEVHLHDGFEFSPTNSAPLLSKGVNALTDADDESHGDYNVEFDTESGADESDELDEADDAEPGSRPGLRLPVGLTLLVGIMAAVHYVRGGNGDFDELVDLDDADDEEHDKVEADAWTDGTERRLL